MSETSSSVLFHPQIHRFSTADGHSCAELAGTGHSSASRNLDTGRPGTWSACHEPGTELHWAQSARVPSDTGTRVPSKSVTLQVPFWHCVHHGKELRRCAERRGEHCAAAQRGQECPARGLLRCSPARAFYLARRFDSLWGRRRHGKRS
jgi:hypothetical protein